MNPYASANTPTLEVDLAALPALIDHGGINKHLAPLARSTLYELATKGEIQSASIGLKRGKRVFVTASIVAWLERRMAITKRPNVAPRQSSAASTQPGGHQ